MAAQRPEGQAASALSVGMHSFAPPDRMEGESPLPPPQEETPAKKPRTIAFSVLLKRNKTCQSTHQPAPALPASTHRQPHGRITRIHAQAVAYLTDPTQHLHPGQAPPTA
ncbi:hypothetical protein AAD027_04740 [Pseudoxanthomonas putridarboris]|uniref:Uncharacterized protein n=2 Tax=Pseudoxanthomonas putridarboris TaxID=752605 RepID=A0ABU9IXK9_9GAMM